MILIGFLLFSVRNISSKAKSRDGEDVVVTVQPYPRFAIREVPAPVDKRALSYPPTRYMGSKEKLLPYIKDVAEHFHFETALDLFSGSGIVGYLFKTMGKQVYSNDYMAMSATFAKALIENNETILTREDIERLFAPNKNVDRFVQETFGGLYYSDSENETIDLVRSNIRKLKGEHKKSLDMAALIRACLKKRARGIFTYTGLRYDDGRADLKMSMEDQIVKAAHATKLFVFDMASQNPDRRRNKVNCGLNKGGLVAFDFELCFAHKFLPVIGGSSASAWLPSNSQQSRNHLFYSEVKANPPQIEQVENMVESLTSSWWKYLMDGFPDEWREPAQRIGDDLLAIAQHKTDFAKDITTRCLQ